MSRSENMRHIRGKNTRPELIVRKLLRELGFPGYRLHRNDLPGKPDVAYLSRRKAIMIHGCFWHGHDCRFGSREPQSNRDYWLPKIQRNRNRDMQNLDHLMELNWSVLTVWECELRHSETLAARLTAFLVDVESASDHHSN